MGLALDDTLGELHIQTLLLLRYFHFNTGVTGAVNKSMVNGRGIRRYG